MTEDFNYEDLIQKVQQECLNHLVEVYPTKNNEVKDEEFILNFIDCLTLALKSEEYKIDFDKKYTFDEYVIIKNRIDNLSNILKQSNKDYPTIIQNILDLLAEYAKAKYVSDGIQYSAGRAYRFNIRIKRINQIIELVNKHLESKY